MNVKKECYDDKKECLEWEEKEDEEWKETRSIPGGSSRNVYRNWHIDLLIESPADNQPGNR